MGKEIKDWTELKELIQVYYNMPTKPSKDQIFKVNANYIFDEDKSVKWNREKVTENNKKYDTFVTELNKRKNDFRDTIMENIYSKIIDECDNKIDRKKALKIWDYCYVHCSDYIFALEMVENMILELILDIL